MSWHSFACLVDPWTDRFPLCFLFSLIKNEWLKPLIASHGGRFAPKKKKKKAAGHGGKTEEQILAAIEAEKLADEAKRLEKIEAELAKAHAFEQEEVRRELQAKAAEEAAQRKADVVL